MRQCSHSKLSSNFRYDNVSIQAHKVTKTIQFNYSGATMYPVQLKKRKVIMKHVINDVISVIFQCRNHFSHDRSWEKVCLDTHVVRHCVQATMYPLWIQCRTNYDNVSTLRGTFLVESRYDNVSTRPTMYPLKWTHCRSKCDIVSRVDTLSHGHIVADSASLAFLSPHLSQF